MFVLGLDGVSYSMVVKLIERGVFKNFSLMLKEGALSPMASAIPEISSVSWTTFMTGKNPAGHGIFGFSELKPYSYEIKFTNFLDVKSKTIFDTLAELGKRVIALNLPFTYPAKRVPGILVSGFFATDLKKAVWPRELFPYLEKKGYEIDIDISKGRKDRSYLCEALFKSLRKRVEVALDFIAKEPFSLFIFVITGTDRINHFLYNSFDDEKSPYHRDFLEYYQFVDECIGIFSERARYLGMPLIILSDHGFCHIKSEFYINSWLFQKGYLRFSKFPPKTLEDISYGTVAFALDPGRIYINLKGKYPRGTVPESIYFKAVDRIISDLYDLEFERGEKVLCDVYFKDEIYKGPFLKDAPDIVVLSNQGFDVKSRLTIDLFGKRDFEGMHTREAFLFLPWEIFEKKKFSMEDPYTIILSRMF